MDIKDFHILVKAVTRAWSLDILALMHNGVEGRQSSLLSKTTAGRTAFKQSLDHLIDLKLLEKNLGHGHPLRAEFKLTSKGVILAETASIIQQISADPIDKTLIRRTWMIPILAISQKPIYYNQLKSELPPITDRALSQSLKVLQMHQWIERHIDAMSYPPRTLYQSINNGAMIASKINLNIARINISHQL
jgi:DNA-binding HxlR family transcriptional regulator